MRLPAHSLASNYFRDFWPIFATRDEMPGPIFASFKISAHYSTLGDLWVNKVNVSFLNYWILKTKK